jgi:hypothetical protein
MWRLLGTLVSGFLLLRDVFGYLLPGALFLGLASVYARHACPNEWLWYLTKHDAVAPFWFFAILMLVLSYVTGQVLVAIGYTGAGAVESLVRRIKKNEKAPTRVPSPEELYLRYLYPAIFTEVDRRGTINILRIGVGVSLMAGSGFLYPESEFAFWCALLVGVFMMYNWRTGVSHVGDVAENTMEAAALAAQAGVPPFDWSAAKNEADEEKKPDEKAKGAGGL